MTLYHAQNITFEVQDEANSVIWHALKSARLQQCDVNHTPVASSHLSESPWRALLSDAGERSIRISLRAYRSDNAADSILSNAALTRRHVTARLTLADGTLLEGEFAVSRMQWGGEGSALEEMVVTIESAGDVNVTELS